MLQKSIVIPPHKLSALESGLKYYSESRINAKTVAEARLTTSPPLSKKPRMTA